jgi:hypothetical protein
MYKNIFKIIILFFIITVLTVFGFKYYYKNFYFNRDKNIDYQQQNIPKQIISNVTTGTTEAILIKLSRLSFPEIINKININSKDIPIDINNFLVSFRGYEQNFKVEKIIFNNNKIGYEIVFIVKQPLIQTYNFFFSSIRNDTKNKKIIYSARANLSSILEFEDNNYQWRIIQTFIDDNENNVKIIVVEK